MRMTETDYNTINSILEKYYEMGYTDGKEQKRLDEALKAEGEIYAKGFEDGKKDATRSFETTIRDNNERAYEEGFLNGHAEGVRDGYARRLDEVINKLREYNDKHTIKANSNNTVTNTVKLYETDKEDIKNGEE